MVLLLPSIIDNPPRLHQYLLFQSSAAQSSLPILRRLIFNSINARHGQTLLFCLLYPPASLVDSSTSLVLPGKLQVLDRIGNVPGYSDDWSDPRDQILSVIRAAPLGPLNVVVDSVDTLASDLGSTSQTYRFLHELMVLIRTRSDPSRLILHLSTPSQLTPLLIQPSMSPVLIQLIAHPTVLLTYLAAAYLTPPPPVSPLAKFWGAFLPFSERSYESDRLVFGAGGEGYGGKEEMVVEVLVRGGVNGSGKLRGVERILEGWTGAGACELNTLESLKNLWIYKTAEEVRHGFICFYTHIRFIVPGSPQQTRRRMCPLISISHPHSNNPEPRSRFPTYMTKANRLALAQYSMTQTLRTTLTTMIPMKT